MKIDLLELNDHKTCVLRASQKKINTCLGNKVEQCIKQRKPCLCPEDTFKDNISFRSFPCKTSCRIGHGATPAGKVEISTSIRRLNRRR